MVLERIDNQYDGPLIEIDLGDEQPVRATIHHPFWVVRGEDLTERPLPRLPQADLTEDRRDGRWVDSHEVRVGDVLLGRDGQPTVVLGVKEMPTGVTPVSNLTIEANRNYCVGLTPVLVHNDSVCAEAIEDFAQQIAMGRITAAQARAAIKKTGKHKATEIDDAIKKILKRSDELAPRVGRFKQGDHIFNKGLGKGFREAADELDDLFPELSNALRKNADELSAPGSPFTRTVDKAIDGVDDNARIFGESLSSFRRQLDDFIETAVGESLDAAKAKHGQSLLKRIDELIEAGFDADAAALLGKDAKSVTSAGQRALLLMRKRLHELF